MHVVGPARAVDVQTGCGISSPVFNNTMNYQKLIRHTTVAALALSAATWAGAEGARPHWEYKDEHRPPPPAPRPPPILPGSPLAPRQDHNPAHTPAPPTCGVAGF